MFSFFRFSKCFTFEKCDEAPVRGGRWGYGGLVGFDGDVFWGGVGGVYKLNKVNWESERVADDCESGATLAVSGRRLVSVGGEKGGITGKRRVREWRNGKWEDISSMLIGCRFPCVVSLGDGGLIVMGGEGKGAWNRLNDVQVFDRKTQSWHIGPPLPQACVAMSAVVHDGMVIVMGGGGMKRAVWCTEINSMVSNFWHLH